jgi:hypothetical protein
VVVPVLYAILFRAPNETAGTASPA